MHIAHGVVKSWQKLSIISDHQIFQTTRILDNIMFHVSYYSPTLRNRVMDWFSRNKEKRKYFIIKCYWYFPVQSVILALIIYKCADTLLWYFYVRSHHIRACQLMLACFHSQSVHSSPRFIQNFWWTTFFELVNCAVKVHTVPES